MSQITRRQFLPLLVLPLVTPKVLWHRGRPWYEYEADGKLYYRYGERTFVVWPGDGDGSPFTKKERARARLMAQEYFKREQQW